jgi:salicylate hydroxylase
LIGDAAHAMVPYQAQGVNQTLEDVEGLNVLFANTSDRNRVPGILQIWDSIRRPRASEIQTGSRASQAKIATKSAGDAILSVKPHVGMKEALKQLET